MLGLLDFRGYHNRLLNGSTRGMVRNHVVSSVLQVLEGSRSSNGGHRANWVISRMLYDFHGH